MVKTGWLRGKSASLLSRPNVVALFVVRRRSRVNGTFVGFDESEKKKDDDDDDDDSIFLFFSIFLEAAAGAKASSSELE